MFTVSSEKNPNGSFYFQCKILHGSVSPDVGGVSVTGSWKYVPENYGLVYVPCSDAFPSHLLLAALRVRILS